MAGKTLKTKIADANAYDPYAASAATIASMGVATGRKVRRGAPRKTAGDLTFVVRGLRNDDGDLLLAFLDGDSGAIARLARKPLPAAPVAPVIPDDMPFGEARDILNRHALAVEAHRKLVAADAASGSVNRRIRNAVWAGRNGIALRERKPRITP